MNTPPPSPAPPASGQFPQYPGFGYQAAGPKPDNYLVWAVLSMVLCWLLFGVVATVAAARVDGLWMAGRYAEACRESESAKKWALVSALVSALVTGGLAVAWFVVWFVVIVLVGVSVKDVPGVLLFV